MRRVVVYGLGAVGGVVAAALALSGTRVAGIARGAHLDAIRSRGLRLQAPGQDNRVALEVAADPAALGVGGNDVILLAVKSQDTVSALESLREAGVGDQPIFCFQNGVANEEMTLRRFPNVHGAMVMMPCTMPAPGEVVSCCGKKLGAFHLGRFPSGTSADDEWLAARLETAGFAAFVTDEVMAFKWGKLLANLTNAVEAATGSRDGGPGDYAERLRAEALAALKAAGIGWHPVGRKQSPWAEAIPPADTAGAVRAGSSTLQSLQRGTGSVETDYLNGEIALLAGKCGLPAPLNARLTEVLARMARDGAVPGSVAPGDLEA